MSIDLFGNEVPNNKITKTQKEEYSEYINSQKWKRIRLAKINQVGGKCEACGITKWSVNLEVHHKDYKNFKHERLSDLQVLCPKCHNKADEERKRKIELSNHERLYDARLNGWAEKVYGEYWQDGDTEYIEEKFNDWLERTQYE